MVKVYNVNKNKYDLNSHILKDIIFLLFSQIFFKRFQKISLPISIFKMQREHFDETGTC